MTFVGAHPWAAAWLAALPLLVLRAGTMAEGDSFWQTRTGLLTLDAHSIPARDTFSWTVSGRPWTLNSWGFNVLLAVAYRLGGLAAVAAFAAACAAGILALDLHLARRAGASPAVTAALLWFATALLLSYLSARPQLVDYAAVLLLILALQTLFTDRSAIRSVVAVGVLAAVWSNLHTGALLAPGITGVTWLAVAAQRATRWATARFGAATLVSLAVFVNPYGIGLITQSRRVMHASESLITEWQPLNPADPVQVVTFLLGCAGLAFAARSRSLVSSVALAVLGFASIGAIRFLPMFLLVSVPVLARGCSTPTVLKYVASRSVMLRRGATVAIAVTTALAAVAASHLGRPDPAAYPSATTVDAIPAGCHVFSTDSLGSYLILVRPDVLVSLDGRNDLYGAERDRAAIAVASGQGDIRQALAGAGCVLLPPRSGLARMLSADPGWREVSPAEPAALFIRAD